MNPQLQSFETCDRSDPEDLWKRAKAAGGPIVAEAASGDEKAVTFVWRGPKDTRSVLLRSVCVQPLRRIGSSDVWKATVVVRSGTRMSYQLAPDGCMDDPWRNAAPDPLNRRLIGKGDMSLKNLWSILELPAASPQPWLQAPTGGLRGSLARRDFQSEVFQDRREVFIYRPPADAAMQKRPGLLILFDGPDFIANHAPATVDNLIVARRIAPLIVAFTGNSLEHPRWKQLRCCPEIVQFVGEELYPWIVGEVGFEFDLRTVIIGGCSRGGLAAAWVASERADLFGNVLAHSGSFWWAPDYDPFDGTTYNRHSATGWLIDQFSSRPPVGLRFYLDSGIYEGEATGHVLRYTRKFNDVLLTLGYPTLYREFEGGHDFLNWRGTIADALQYLLPEG